MGGERKDALTNEVEKDKEFAPRKGDSGGIEAWLRQVGPGPLIFLHLVAQALKEVSKEIPPAERIEIKKALQSLRQAFEQEDIASINAILQKLIRVSAKVIPQAYRQASSKEAAK